MKVEIPLKLEIFISGRESGERRDVRIMKKDLIPIQIELPDWLKEIPKLSSDIMVTMKVSGEKIILGSSNVER
jgi:hypothetical protein